MQRLGLCCLFVGQEVRFRTTTVRYLSSLPQKGEDPHQFLSTLIVENFVNLHKAVETCFALEIRAFRINSRLMPIYTHPEWGYTVKDLPDQEKILQLGKKVKESAEKCNVRLSFHPDQFVVLNSPDPSVVEKSVAEIELHALLADLVGADVINIHGGGGYGDKEEAMSRFAANFQNLSASAKEKLTIENDDRVYTPEELLPLCQKLQIPLVYDVHHHRCLQDSLSVEEATQKALATWTREPLFHISSPKEGWKGKNPRLHHDFIDPKDLPECWKTIDPLTIDVEAKKKEEAVIALQTKLNQKGWHFS